MKRAALSKLHDAPVPAAEALKPYDPAAEVLEIAAHVPAITSPRLIDPSTVTTPSVHLPSFEGAASALSPLAATARALDGAAGDTPSRNTLPPFPGGMNGELATALLADMGYRMSASAGGPVQLAALPGGPRLRPGLTSPAAAAASSSPSSSRLHTPHTPSGQTVSRGAIITPIRVTRAAVAPSSSSAHAIGPAPAATDTDTGPATGAAASSSRIIVTPITGRRQTRVDVTRTAEQQEEDELLAAADGDDDDGVSVASSSSSSSFEQLSRTGGGRSGPRGSGLARSHTDKSNYSLAAFASGVSPDGRPLSPASAILAAFQRLQEQYDEVRGERDALSAQVATLTTKLRAATARAATARTPHKEGDSTEEHKERDGDGGEGDGEGAEEEEGGGELQRQRDATASALAAATAAQEALAAARALAQQEAAVASAVLQAAQDRIAVLEYEAVRDADVAKQEAAAAAARVAAAEEATAAARTTVAVAAASADAAETARAAAEGELTSLRDAAEAAQRALQERVEQLEKRCADAEDNGKVAQAAADAALGQLATLKAERDKAVSEGSEAKRRSIALAAQASTATASMAEVRRELLQTRVERDKLAATLAGRGCDRCRPFDLPELEYAEAEDAATAAADSKERSQKRKADSEYHRTLLAEQGPWFSVTAVRGALAEAAAVRLCLLAPTVKVTVTGRNTHDDSSSTGTTTDAATCRAPAPLTALQTTLEQEVLPRFASVFAVPRLQLKPAQPDKATAAAQAKGGAGTGGAPLAPPATVVTDAALDAWVRQITGDMEAAVREALVKSEHYRVSGGGSGGSSSSGSSSSTRSPQKAQ